jgi:hypothetical protein
MNMSKDGGPAFPVHRDYEAFNPAMSLRDYFAAKAMQGLLAAQVHGFNDSPSNGPFARMAPGGAEEKPND